MKALKIIAIIICLTKCQPIFGMYMKDFFGMKDPFEGIEDRNFREMILKRANLFSRARQYDLLNKVNNGEKSKVRKYFS